MIDRNGEVNSPAAAAAAGTGAGGAVFPASAVPPSQRASQDLDEHRPVAKQATSLAGAKWRDQGDFGERWIQTLVAAAGLGCATEGVERSIGEFCITYPHRIGKLSEWAVKAQVKTVAGPRQDSRARIRYSLDADSHRRLAGPAQMPTFLFLVATDEERANWVVTQPDGDKLSYGAYWISLEGDAPTTNRSKKTIYVPIGNRISPISLIELCRRTAREFHLKMGMQP